MTLPVFSKVSIKMQRWILTTCFSLLVVLPPTHILASARKTDRLRSKDLRHDRFTLEHHLDKPGPKRGPMGVRSPVAERDIMQTGCQPMGTRVKLLRLDALVFLAAFPGGLPLRCHWWRAFGLFTVHVSMFSLRHERATCPAQHDSRIVVVELRLLSAGDDVLSVEGEAWLSIGDPCVELVSYGQVDSRGVGRPDHQVLVILPHPPLPS